MVNYPHNLIRQKPNSVQKRSKQNKVDFANRGMSFEATINATNDYYLSQQIAVIHKKPTPIQIVKVDYPKRSRAKIVEAYFRQASTTDYSGVYKGHYIDFEAKETRQKTAMPMKNFHLHQIEHMVAVLEQQGICFVLLHFSTLKETYYLPAKALIDFYQIDHGNKSMPLDYIRKHGFEIVMGAFPQVPYLDIIEQNFLGGDYN
ncbi:UNVERIFIED_CONTAM: Holliday junction resolvase RecU [Streptococcus canis]|uniref:Holliday junction resolvase RecU n=2 Tax=Streptococcus canis TaxID=1329 RepID=A0AAE4Q6N5_STRCB|nr:Holliday junction resolvase RecU [Streptococcus canis]EIQ82463.1 Holliday junction-specific endonuclease [Streptococcus canis FSL Z3-227]MDV5973753.1 Holliday junction resolvase RecU [Streptococcus canis]MDV5977391.1 Holliday junction resolvase RecU [Streptococcus canis]MDV5988814.1 Holliday junction resolvase RecU [Streptococcus canis]MDV5994099.1 Holliday junction resolvase RecU [Streptococcus canis]